MPELTTLIIQVIPANITFELFSDNGFDHVEIGPEVALAIVGTLLVKKGHKLIRAWKRRK